MLSIYESIPISTASIPVPTIPGGKVGDEGAIVSLVYGDEQIPTPDEDQKLSIDEYNTMEDEYDAF